MPARPLIGLTLKQARINCSWANDRNLWRRVRGEHKPVSMLDEHPLHPLGLLGGKPQSSFRRSLANFRVQKMIGTEL